MGGETLVSQQKTSSMSLFLRESIPSAISCDYLDGAPFEFTAWVRALLAELFISPLGMAGCLPVMIAVAH